MPWRHYFGVYDRHLSRFRGRPVRLVEVGVFGGGSLAMWREYLGPDCQVYGVDIDPTCEKHAAAGVEVLIGDQSDPEFWAEFTSRVPAVDIVVDDGGHAASQRIPTLEALLPPVGSSITVVSGYGPVPASRRSARHGMAGRPGAWVGGPARPDVTRCGLSSDMGLNPHRTRRYARLG